MFDMKNLKRGSGKHARGDARRNSLAHSTVHPKTLTTLGILIINKSETKSEK
jgi:hypothetical protein